MQPVVTSVSDTAAMLTNDVTGNEGPAATDISTGQGASPADTILALATSPNTPIEAPLSAPAGPANIETDTSNAVAAVSPIKLAGM